MEPIVNVVLPVFAIILAGYLSGRFRILGEESSEALNRFVFYVALPVLLFYSMARVEPAQIFNWPFIGAFATGSVATMAIAMLAARIMFRTQFSEKVLFGMTAVWANTGYMGIPLAIVAFGDAGALPAIIATVFQSVVLLVLVTALIEMGRRGPGLGGIGQVLTALLRNPLIISPALGIAWSIAGWRLPVPVATFCAILSPAAGPAALFAIGLFLVGKPIRRGFGEVAAMTMFKLVVHPLVTWWCVSNVFELDPLWSAVAILLAALPAGANCFVVAQNNGIYVHRTSAAILVSTILAVVTVSILFGLEPLASVAVRP